MIRCMMALQTLVFLILTELAATGTSIRDVPIVDKPRLNAEMRQDDSSNATADCWAALSELRSCSNEIIGFFLNGQTDIDTPCCHAIEVIMQHCWPPMLTVLGISAEEGKLLAGHCEESSGPAGSPSVSNRF